MWGILDDSTLISAVQGNANVVMRKKILIERKYFRSFPSELVVETPDGLNLKPICKYKLHGQVNLASNRRLTELISISLTDLK